LGYTVKDVLSAPKRVQGIAHALADLKDESLEEALVIISPGRVRIRRKREESPRKNSEAEPSRADRNLRAETGGRKTPFQSGKRLDHPSVRKEAKRKL